MHQWLRLTEWAPLSAALLGWIAVIAALGYAAAVVAWRDRQS